MTRRRIDVAAHLAVLNAMPGRDRPAQPAPDCACALTGAACTAAPPAHLSGSPSS